MEILPITKDIASGASHIYALSWKAAYQGIVPQQYLDELSLERWTPFLQESPYLGFVLKDDEKFIATSSISPARDETMQDWGEIISLYALPEYFYRGYGKKLLSFVLSELKGKGFEKVYLWVLEENVQARAFYERNGFVFNGDKTNITIGGKSLVEVRYTYLA